MSVACFLDMEMCKKNSNKQKENTKGDIGNQSFQVTESPTPAKAFIYYDDKLTINDSDASFVAFVKEQTAVAEMLLPNFMKNQSR